MPIVTPVVLSHPGDILSILLTTMRFQNTNTTNPNNNQINKHTKTNQERTYTKQQIEMSSPQKHTKNNFTILKIPHILSMVHIVG